MHNRKSEIPENDGTQDCTGEWIRKRHDVPSRNERGKCGCWSDQLLTINPAVVAITTDDVLFFNVIVKISSLISATRLERRKCNFSVLSLNNLLSAGRS